ncbi:hypothetical protein N6H14_21410 [Paenibacillus sp. CC-CFT747]|nr:hypothetical protein N6H14_21410 [Paenibacillus sp. CC-CFT747]
MAGETLVGTAMTDADGYAALAYPIGLRVTGETASTTYPVTASVYQNDTHYYRGSVASGSLTVAREKSSLLYTGPDKASQDGDQILSVQVVQEQDGSAGSLTGLPVRFTISAIRPDGTLSEIDSSVTEHVYRTDSEGNVRALVHLPSGLYQVEAQLLPNPYYESVHTVSQLAVFDPAMSPLQASGFIELEGDGFFGEKAKRLHLNIGPGKGKLHAEPQGKEFIVEAVNWFLVSGNAMYWQGRRQGTEPGMSFASCSRMTGTGKGHTRRFRLSYGRRMPRNLFIRCTAPASKEKQDKEARRFPGSISPR